MDPQTLEGLILDLRGNPGGLLQEAIKVGETFLQQRSADPEDRRPNERFGSGVSGQARKMSDPPYPLVVLVDQNSASASEIVSGAIQDHDRGLIVGETTFGKGLVQSVYTLRNNAGSRCGIAAHDAEVVHAERPVDSAGLFPDFAVRLLQSPRQSRDDKKKEVKYSDNGRIVYGGGGITPDVIVERPKPNDFQNTDAGELRRSFPSLTSSSRRILRSTRPSRFRMRCSKTSRSI